MFEIKNNSNIPWRCFFSRKKAKFIKIFTKYYVTFIMEYFIDLNSLSFT